MGADPCDPDGFAERLCRLMVLAGSPTLARTAAAANKIPARGQASGRRRRLTPQRLSDWRRGRHLPADHATLAPLITALHGMVAHVTRDPEATPALPGDDALLSAPMWERWLREAHGFPGGEVSEAAADGPSDTTGDAPSDACPYPGLAEYGVEDAARFHGRARAVADLVARIRRADERIGAPAVVGLTAPSAAGKSSLLAAGLVGGRALDTPDERWRYVRRLADEIDEETAAQLAADTDPSVPTVLVVDRMEQLFAGTDRERRRAFTRALVDLTTGGREDGRRGVVAVLAIRADTLAECLELPILGAQLAVDPMVLAPMTDDELRDVITVPARQAGLRIEPGLVDLVIGDVHRAADAEDDRAGRLPLLSHVLRATWHRRTHATLTVRGYRAVGGVAGSVAQAAEAMWSRLDDRSRREARAVLMSLVHIHPGGVVRTASDVDTAMAASDAPAVTRAVVATLVDARLITLTARSLTLVHESLLVAWPRLAEWIAEDARVGPVRQRVVADARAWADQGRDRHFLYTGTRLAQVAPVLGGPGGAPASGSRLADEFLAASLRRDRRLESARRYSVLGICLLFLVMTGVAGYAALAQRSAARERDRAVLASLLATSDSLRETDPSVSARLLAEAHRLRPSDPGVTSRLVATETMPLARAVDAHVGTVYDLARSQDGRTVATIGQDRSVRLWRLDTPTARMRPAAVIADAHGGFGTSVDLSPDDATMVTAGGDGVLRLWDVADPARPRAVGEPVAVGAAQYLTRFSPDGRSVASGGDDGVVRVYDVTDRQRPRVRTVLGMPGAPAVRSVAFGPGGATLVAGSDDGVARLWDMSAGGSGPPTATVVVGTRPVHGVAISPDGSRLALADDDASVRVMALGDGPPAPFGDTIDVHTDAVWAVAFSPDSQTLVTGGDDGRVFRWDVRSGDRPVAVGPAMSTTAGAVKAATYTADGSALVTAGADGRLRVWELPRSPIAAPGAGAGDTAAASAADLVAIASANGTVGVWRAGATGMRRLSSVTVGVGPVTPTAVLSDDGRTLVTAGGPGTAVSVHDLADPSRPRTVGPPIAARTRYVAHLAVDRAGSFLVATDTDTSVGLWDLSDPAGPQRRATIRPSAAFVDAVAVTPDGDTLVVASSDGSVRRWDVTDRGSPRSLPPLASHVGAVRTVSVTPDGSRVVTGGDDATVRVTDLRTGASGETRLAGGVESVAVDPRSAETIAVATRDHRVELQRLDDLRVVADGDAALEDGRLTAGRHRLAFLADGSLVSAGDDTVRRWTRDVDADLARVCARTDGSLTESTWQALTDGRLGPAPRCR